MRRCFVFVLFLMFKLGVSTMKQYKYHIAISYATEQIEYARELKDALKRKNLSVFLDEDEPARFWGVHITDELRKIYKEESQQIVILLSADYMKKDYPNFEAHIASERALKGQRLCVIKMDESKIPWINSTIGYKSANDNTISELASQLSQIVKKNI